VLSYRSAGRGFDHDINATVCLRSLESGFSNLLRTTRQSLFENKKGASRGRRLLKEGSGRAKILWKKQSAGWAQPLVFLLIRIPGLRFTSSNGIIGESLFSSHTANPVDSFGIYLKKVSYS
jgi:hypothetical protein